MLYQTQTTQVGTSITQWDKGYISKCLSVITGKGCVAVISRVCYHWINS